MGEGRKDGIESRAKEEGWRKGRGRKGRESKENGGREGKGGRRDGRVEKRGRRE